MRLGVAARCGLLALSVALAGCGGSAHKSAPAPAPRPTPARVTSRAPQLVAVAERTPEEAYFGTPTPSTVYIIYVQRHILQVGTEHEPRRLTR
jgi:hypothetical protein